MLASNVAKIVTEPLAVASGCQTQPALKYSWLWFTLIILDISYGSEQLLYSPEIPLAAATNPGAVFPVPTIRLSHSARCICLKRIQDPLGLTIGRHHRVHVVCAKVECDQVSDGSVVVVKLLVRLSHLVDPLREVLGLAGDNSNS
jgi:hypothetical protein